MVNLVNKMTLEEKAGQLTQLIGFLFENETSEVTGPISEMKLPEQLLKTSGSVLGSSGAATIKKIQKEYLEKSRLKIPLLFMADIVHGYKTIFPIPLAIGATWNLELAERSAEIAAIESAVSGLHVTFAPMVDLVRDPRWGRVMESTGEDGYLNDLYARAFVRGFQGENLAEDKKRVAACVKHFAAYGAPEAGREYNTVNMSERQLRQDYLSSYKAAIDEGAALVMTSFNTVDGIPSSGNRWLMRDLLREEWDFDGVVISDWGAVKELIPHGIAEDGKEAAEKALLAGVDIEMMTFTYARHLEYLLKKNKGSEERVNESVLRVLELKNALGLFEDPYRGLSEELEEKLIFSQEHLNEARKTAEESIVLLKNNAILPLNEHKKVALIGPFAKGENILGSWAWKGNDEKLSHLADAMIERVRDQRVESAKGCGITEIDDDLLSEALEMGQHAEIIVAAVGEHVSMSGEAASRTNIRLPEAQLKLIKELKKLNKPLIVVLFNGRPLDLHGIIDKADAVLEAWFPGSEGGRAITRLLYGDVNPSGKVTMSFPYNVGQVPVYYNAFNTGRPLASAPEEKYVSKYLDSPNEPLIPFGFGMSYTTFEYGELEISADEFTEEQSLQISVEVRNTGSRKGKEIVQFYVRDLSGEVVRPVKELKGFKKIELQPNESESVSFELTEKMVRYFHSDLSLSSDAGAFEVFVGPSSAETESKKVKLIKRSTSSHD